MPKWCSVGTCSNHHLMKDENGGQKYRFFSFPRHDKYPERRARWAQACGRRMSEGSQEPWYPPENVTGVYICSEHFISGQPQSSDEHHPDYVPSVNLKATKPCISTGRTNEEQKLRRYTNAVKRKFKVLPAANEQKAKTRRSLDTTAGENIPENSDALSESDVGLNDTGMSESPWTATANLKSILKKPMKAPAPAITPVYVAESAHSMAFEEAATLEKEVGSLRKELEKTQARLNTVRLSVNIVQDNPEKCRFYTGLSWDVFLSTYDIFADCVLGKGVPIIPYIDQFFITLVKMKHDHKFEYLADQVGISTSSVIDIFWKWVDLIVVKLDWMLCWPDRDLVHRTIPPHFKALYPKMTCIIDCFEIFVEAPSNLKARAQLWSNYKKHTTIKCLIGCNSRGAVSFLSKAWGGRASDIEIVKKSGFMTAPPHMPGDQILADRGFTLKDEFAAIAGVDLIMPSLIKGRNQFSAKDVETSRQISSVRIHIERVIGGIKNRFAILQGTLSLRLIKSLKEEAENADLTSADKLLRACSILYNLQPSIICKDQ